MSYQSGSSWGDIPKEAFQEREYRRGYRDGWIQAANTIIDIWFMRDKQRIYDVLFEHFEGLLWEWMQADCCQVIEPPHPTGALCAYCGNPAEHMDHIIPKSRGGSDDPGNLTPACAACNMAKRDRTPEEWLQEQNT